MNTFLNNQTKCVIQNPIQLLRNYVYIVTNSFVFPACAVGDDEQSDWFFEGESGEGGWGWAFPACCPAGTQTHLLS